jgi:predicted phosphodiesterase
MNILVLSDLHIDACDNFGTFQWNEMDLIMQIEGIREIYSVDKVILNGDVFELIKYTYDEIRKANPVLMRYFSDNDFIFIRGNHDLINELAVDHYDIVNSKGQSIHLEHGHKADWLNGTKFGQGIGKIALSLLKKMSHSKYMMDIYFKIITLEDEINHIPKKYNTIKYLTYALKLLKDHDVVIFGHTHKLEAHHTYYLNKKKRYLNSGACTLGRFQGIIMDTETLKYDLIKESKESIKNSYLVRQAI